MMTARSNKCTRQRHGQAFAIIRLLINDFLFNPENKLEVVKCRDTIRNNVI